MTPIPRLAVTDAAAATPRIIVGIGEVGVAADRATIVTHALGSCVAVCAWDAMARVGGLLHFLLPEGRIHPERALEQPAAFADCGVPLLLHSLESAGARRDRCRVYLIGGAETDVESMAPLLCVGRRNVQAARRVLGRHGLQIQAAEVGGRRARTVHLDVASGAIVVTSGVQSQEL